VIFFKTSTHPKLDATKAREARPETFSGRRVME
jgi:hypothetical protein